MRVIKKLIPILLVACMIFSLAACGQQDKNGPKTAAELLTLNEKTVRNNYMQTTQMVIDTQIVKSMLSSESIHMPIEVAVAAAVFDENHMHSSSVSKMSVFGNNVTSKTEMYLVDDDIYMSSTSNDDSPAYIKTTREEAGLNATDLADLSDVNVFNNATLEFDSKLNQYVVTVKTEDLLKYISMQELLGGSLDGLSQMDQEAQQAMIEAFGNSHVIYYYNQSYELVKCEIKDMQYEYADAGAGTIQMSVNLIMDFSNYGKITAEDVAVPAEFENAVDLSSIVDQENSTPSMVGSWEKVEDGTITDELLTIYNAASIEDNPYKPKQLLATQLVSGMNYLFLVEDENGNEGIIGIYKDLEGNVSLLDNSLLPSEYIPGNESTETNTSMKESWFEVVIDGKTVKPGVDTVEQYVDKEWLASNGYIGTLKLDEQKQIVLESNGKEELSIYAVNNSSEVLPIENCVILGFIYEVFDGEPTHDVVICEDVAHTTTKDQALAKLGEPSYEYSFSSDPSLAEFDWDDLSENPVVHINLKFKNDQVVKFEFLVY